MNSLRIAVFAFMPISVWGQSSGSALAKFNSTGNDLVRQCSYEKDKTKIEALADQSACLGFIHGALQGFSGGLEFNHKGSRLPTGLLCILDEVTNGQMVKVILAYSDKNPAQLNGDAAAIVWGAMSEAWGAEFPQHPCP